MVSIMLEPKASLFGGVQKSVQAFCSSQKEGLGFRACLQGNRGRSRCAVRGPTAADAFVSCGRGGPCCGGQDAHLTRQDHSLVDNRGSMAADYAIVHACFEIIWSLSLSKSEAIEALLKEVREQTEARRAIRNRKRDVHATEACPNGQRQSAIGRSPLAIRSYSA